MKPQNILLNLEAGLVKVADMGLGRVLRKKYEFYTEEVCLYLRRTLNPLPRYTNHSNVKLASLNSNCLLNAGGNSIV